MIEVAVPQYHELMFPVLDAVKALGGSATNDEMQKAVVEALALTEQQQQVMHKDSRLTEIEYRTHWARTHLRGIGALENSKRGVWAVTELGEHLTEADMHARTKAWRAELRAKRLARAAEESSTTVDVDAADDDLDWKEQVLNHLLRLPPAGFERLSQRLLREAGFINVTVTGKSGDGGIDGAGVYRVSLVSFPVYFQCKRYKGTVSASVVRDFRGAMVGRGEKGLLITTGSFSKDATVEANRDGAPPVELIDGDRLCDLLKEYGLGVRVTQRTVEDIEVVPTFFEDYHS